MYTVQVVITTKHFFSCSPKGTLVTLCINKREKPLQSAKLCKKTQRLCNGFFICFIFVFFHSAFANTLPSLKAPSNKEQTHLSQVESIATKPIVKVATPSAIASPKLKLSTQISNLQHTKLADKQRSSNSMSAVADAINAPKNTNIASNSAIVEHHTSSQLNDESAKKDVENRWQEENKWLIAFILIFVTAIAISFVLAKYK